MSLSPCPGTVSVKDKPHHKKHERDKQQQWQKVKEQADSKQHKYDDNDYFNQIEEYSHNNVTAGSLIVEY